MKRFENKVAVVTGAAGAGAGGTGKAIAQGLAKEGASVVLVDINEENGKATEKEFLDAGYDVFFVKCDVTQEDQIKTVISNTIEKYKKINILVNVAFITVPSGEGLVENLDVSTWDKIFSVNIRGTFLMAKHCLPYLVKNDSSSIVNVSSTSTLGSDDINTAYASSKGAMNIFSRYVATQYGREGLRCNTVIPGLILSKENDALFYQDPASKDFFDELDRHLLINRHASGEDIANAVLFLADDEAAACITGQALVVDGGMSIHNPTWAQWRENSKDPGKM